MALPDFISDTDEVRRLARSVPTNDFTDPQIELQQKAAYSGISIDTHKSDWSVSDPGFYKIQKIEQQYAAAYVLEYYGNGTAEELNMIASLRAGADADIAKVVASGTGAELDTTILTASSDYASYPASLIDDPYTSYPYRSTTTQL